MLPRFLTNIASRCCEDCSGRGAGTERGRRSAWQPAVPARWRGYRRHRKVCLRSRCRCRCSYAPTRRRGSEHAGGELGGCAGSEECKRASRGPRLREVLSSRLWKARVANKCSKNASCCGRVGRRRAEARAAPVANLQHLPSCLGYCACGVHGPRLLGHTTLPLAYGLAVSGVCSAPVLDYCIRQDLISAGASHQPQLPQDRPAEPLYAPSSSPAGLTCFADSAQVPG